MRKSDGGQAQRLRGSLAHAACLLLARGGPPSSALRPFQRAARPAGGLGRIGGGIGIKAERGKNSRESPQVSKAQQKKDSEAFPSAKSDMGDTMHYYMPSVPHAPSTSWFGRCGAVAQAPTCNNTPILLGDRSHASYGHAQFIRTAARLAGMQLRGFHILTAGRHPISSHEPWSFGTCTTERSTAFPRGGGNKYGFVASMNIFHFPP